MRRRKREEGMIGRESEEGEGGRRGEKEVVSRMANWRVSG